MVSIDPMPLKEMKEYIPKLSRKADFFKFWEDSINELQKYPVNFEEYKIEYPIRDINVFKIKSNSYKNTTVYGYYLTPSSKGKFPSLLTFPGYMVSKGYVNEYIIWPLIGFNILIIDIRGQAGESGDSADYNKHGHTIGWLTKGILDIHEYFYRGVYLDCLRALEVLKERQEVDKDNVGVFGDSQGGWLSLVTAALSSGVKSVVASIPFLCDFERAVMLTDPDIKSHTYPEIKQFLKYFPELEVKVFETISYFDVKNFTSMISHELNLYCSVHLEDRTCPPSTIYGVYNLINCKKEMKLYKYFDHEINANFNDYKICFLIKTLKDRNVKFNPYIELGH